MPEQQPFDAFAESTDVSAVWGELTAGQEALVDAWLEQASNQVRLLARQRGADVDALVAADRLSAVLVRDAVVNAVKRVLMNPEGYRQLSRTKGPFTESGTIDTALSTGMIYIAEADIAGLFPVKRSRFGSFRMKAGLL
ncbi:Gp19/Gp15/Gp42 family protein [Curtobacterium sp. MCBA15_004]|uniref:Gp19/Gp15/Gp42 family protein n=1 Tax=Curtobacterium sp. MCBA15_004 TaxID=1898733 RepID=UPI0008DDFE79|nr:Gp19/Gp15/Gp42 family protein [Curtobacterium sp. MCBA15_004]WIA95805.1 Gp19/Gp15/Gp42 family protein [Curtobacterium sp. MCBA15_004]